MHKDEVGNSYLVFGVEDEFFAVKILYVREILEYKKPTSLPLNIPFILGVINLRGQIIPIFDLWAFFGLGSTRIYERSYFVILELGRGKEFRTFGLVAQSLVDVMEFSHNLEPAPDFGSQVPSRFLEGIGKIKEKFILVLASEVCFHPENLKSQVFDFLKREVSYAHESTRDK